MSFSCQTRVSPLCDDLPKFRCKLVAVTSQPLIKRTIRPVGRLLSHFLVLRGFALVLLQFRLKITQHGATPLDATRARMVAGAPAETMTDLRQFCSHHAARLWLVLSAPRVGPNARPAFGTQIGRRVGRTTLRRAFRAKDGTLTG